VQRTVQRMLRLTAFLLLTIVCPAVIVATVQPNPGPPQTNLSRHEQQAWKALARSTEFNDIPHVSDRWHCEGTEPPQALATPDPLVISAGYGTTIKVVFIVGTDGRVHSPLVLESGGPIGDRSVLRALRTWRYRPATCNGVPTESEGKIEFSRR
jgi:TonB family protein